MKTSEAGISLIAGFEGLRLEAYQDQVGVWTIGYGHTGPDVRKGMKITLQDARDLLAHDLAKFEDAVDRALSRTPTQNQFNAMVSLAFNIGGGAFAKSSVARNFNAGSVTKAADSFLLWNKAGGKVNKGLANRRTAERKVFLTKEGDEPMVDVSSNKVVAVISTPATSKINWTQIVGILAMAGSFFGLHIDEGTRAELVAGIGGITALVTIAIRTFGMNVSPH